MTTQITKTSPTEKQQAWFGVADTKGRKVGAVVLTYSVTYENSATGCSSLPEGTFYFVNILENRGQKWFDSTSVRGRFATEAERSDFIAASIENRLDQAHKQFAKS
jgi:hypothetical protein